MSTPREETTLLEPNGLKRIRGHSSKEQARCSNLGWSAVQIFPKLRGFPEPGTFSDITGTLPSKPGWLVTPVLISDDSKCYHWATVPCDLYISSSARFSLKTSGFSLFQVSWKPFPPSPLWFSTAISHHCITVWGWVAKSQTQPHAAHLAGSKWAWSTPPKVSSSHSVDRLCLKGHSTGFLTSLLSSQAQATYSSLFFLLHFAFIHSFPLLFSLILRNLGYSLWAPCLFLSLVLILLSAKPSSLWLTSLSLNLLTADLASNFQIGKHTVQWQTKQYTGLQEDYFRTYIYNHFVLSFFNFLLGYVLKCNT